jgi:RIO kinase 1
VRIGSALRQGRKDLGQRSFQARAQYQEGRKVLGSRQACAMRRGTSWGRKEQETAWKNTEVDALYQLADVGVRVPAPYGFFNGVLVMELVPTVAPRPTWVRSNCQPIRRASSAA